MPVKKSELSRSARIKHFVANLFIRSFLGLVGMVPYTLRVPMMGWLVSCVLAPLGGLRKRIRNNLKLIQSDLSEAEIQQLCLDVCNNLGRVLIEYYSPPHFVHRAQAATSSGDGFPALEQAKAAGRPIIFVSAHFGNYEAARVFMTSKGFKMGAFYRRMSNPYFNDHYVKALGNLSQPLFEQGRRGMTELVKHLRAGESLCILTDLHAHGGAKLDFFGKPAITSTIVAELALKYDCLLVPTYSIRKPNGLDFHIEIHAPIEHSDPITMTQAINDDLEAMVRQHMGQWFWTHRRWKP